MALHQGMAGSRFCIVTASGIDSRQQNFEVIASVVGAAAELDRKEAAYRTRRGLEGIAVAGRSAGGKAYGYIAARDSGTAQIEINEREAGVVAPNFRHVRRRHVSAVYCGKIERGGRAFSGGVLASERHRTEREAAREMGGECDSR